MIVEVKYRSCNIGYIILYHFWGDWLSASLGVFEDYSASLVMDSSYNWNCSLPQKTESVGVEGDIVSANCCVLHRLLETEYEVTGYESLYAAFKCTKPFAILCPFCSLKYTHFLNCTLLKLLSLLVAPMILNSIYKIDYFSLGLQLYWWRVIKNTCLCHWE